MKNVYLCQVNYKYGENVFLPYAVALLQAYCQTIPEITKNYNFKPFIFLRSEPEEVAAGLEKPAVLGISCYIWNWEWSKRLAAAAKRLNPDCLIVMGGPQVPEHSQDFFRVNGFVDILVHYEGELTFAELLVEYCKRVPDFTKVAGLSVRTSGNNCVRTPPRERVSDLSTLPSPYLAGLFDDLATLPYSWNACQETHRGCPYSCTFCDWGSAVYSQVRRFGDDRLTKEFAWMGENKVELLYNCDANYGLFPRDLELTSSMAEIKSRFGYPKQFRAAFAKNSTTRVYEIARLLNHANMDKGITLSFQSMDTATLTNIKRINISVKDFANLMNMYRAEGIETYSELILSLPGETYDSFADGVGAVLEAGQHDGLNIYLCQILPNAEMAEPAYKAKFGLVSMRSPLLRYHTTPSKDEILEYTEYVTETNTMPPDDWKRTYVYSWAVQAFHCLGLTQSIAIILRRCFGIPYRSFYEAMLEFGEDHPQSIIGSELRSIRAIVEGALAGGHWEVIAPEFGEITWPPEEATFLRISADKEPFFNEVGRFVEHLLKGNELPADGELVGEIVSLQKALCMDPRSPGNMRLSLRYNLHEFLTPNFSHETTPLQKGAYVVSTTASREYDGQLEKFAREVVWYGRKGGRFQRALNAVQPSVERG